MDVEDHLPEAILNSYVGRVMKRSKEVPTSVYEPRTFRNEIHSGSLAMLEMTPDKPTDG